MKKWLLLSALLFSSLYALPVGNPMDASLYRNGLFCDGYDTCCDPCNPCFSWCDAWSFRIGFYGDYVYNRNMDLKDFSGGDIEETTLYTNAALLTLNICNRLDIFGTLGATSLYLNTPSFTLAGDFIHFIELWSETAFSWSVGARYTIWNCDCFYFGVEGQYFSVCTDLDHLYVPGNIIASPSSIDIDYYEWQVGLGAAYLINVGCSGVSAIPYIAVKVSDSCWKMGNAQVQVGSNVIPGSLQMRDLEACKNWGYAVGTTVTFCSAFGVTVEGRFGDEKAIHVNGQLRF